jgi:nucleotide-binding universal stress UspA family protein
VRDDPALSEYARDLPESVRALFAGGELDVASPAGYLNSQIFALMAPLLLPIFAIGAGSAAVAGEEERGTLDLVLAHPIRRRNYVFQRFLDLTFLVVARSRRGRGQVRSAAAMEDAQTHAPPVFKCIVCGVDGTPESLVAVRQAVRLQDPLGCLYLTSVAPLAKAAHAGFAASHAAELLQHEAEAALAEAQAIAPAASAKLANGDPVPILLREVEAEQATLVTVGSHGRGRAAGMLLGTVAARMLRDAPCSVLIARAPRDQETWPRSVVVGIDGSVESAAAFAVANSLAERFGASTRAVASSGNQFDRKAAQQITSEFEEQPGRAVDELAAASDSADLIVVGSRGLHGLKALGSVSERVANQARSSVLVVRP